MKFHSCPFGYSPGQLHFVCMLLPVQETERIYFLKVFLRPEEARCRILSTTESFFIIYFLDNVVLNSPIRYPLPSVHVGDVRIVDIASVNSLNGFHDTDGNRKNNHFVERLQYDLSTHHHQQFRPGNQPSECYGEENQ